MTATADDSAHDGVRPDVEQAVIARFRVPGEGFGEPADRATVRAAERLVAELVERAGVGEWDGHEFGGGEVLLFAYGPDADALFAVAEPTLRGLPFRPASVLLRYGPALDPATPERRVEL
ncbi:hypothetical protein HUT16_04685 [Kitasatospora sp. NA04385]|uniref:hypothetical protein n=1 Tax=Kitasatospora sp. NA04385 TaxID=2742135 RepID=UPI001592031B|nr:hypothetical protein [Kitasatospora sp. NA04385]QKW18455.1 hypothetical protein HUT16_04685 [Kitasatospora sp. NA04385]